MPNRNHSRFLLESLGSIARQTRPADEVIVIDDGSTDDSTEVIAEFLDSRSNWHMIRIAESHGVIAALNRGMAEAKGDWITFLGADDVMAPSFLEKMLRQVRRKPDAGLMSGCAGVLSGDHRCSVRPIILPATESGFISAERFRQLLRIGDNFFVGTVVLYRRQALLELGGFDPSLGPMCDGFVARRLAVRFGFGFVPAILGYWRLHGENFSRVTAGNVGDVERMVARAKEVIAAEPPGVFPPGYGGALDRRVRFGSARLLIFEHSLPVEDRVGVISALLGANNMETGLLRSTLACGFPGALAALAWLSLRLRPFSFIRLGLEPLRRRAVLGFAPFGRASGAR